MMRRPLARPMTRGVVGTIATTAVVAGTATAVSGKVAQNQQAKAQQAAQAQAFEQQQQQAAMQAAAEQAVAQQAAAAPAPAAPPADPIAQLTQLAALRDQGVLTDAEFEAQKAKILA